MSVQCSKCGANTTYSEGPGHLWRSVCTSCGFREEGTFSPAIPPNEELEKDVKCYFQLGNISEVSELRQLLPELSHVAVSEISEKLRSNSLRWSLGSMTLGNAIRLRNKAENFKLRFIIEP